MSPISMHTAPRGRRAPTVRVLAFLACVVSAWAMTACAAAPTASDTDQTPSTNRGIVSGTLEVTANPADRVLTLRNTTAADVGYLVVERDMITVALFPPCGQRCPILAPGASVTVPYTAIAGYTPQAREARVLWWSYRRNADGTRSAQGATQTTSITL
ncbi:hypothetical protein [Gemmatimonas sp.]|jgi:hypothetical protein|uniref:hypothetical protein n=1 Tax=Gemmatimonas sp. TaxID=1962908 RepID=UPI0037C0AAD2